MTVVEAWLMVIILLGPLCLLVLVALAVLLSALTSGWKVYEEPNRPRRPKLVVVQGGKVEGGSDAQKDA